MRWFVYCDRAYYPFAETVEAPTAQEAAAAVEAEHGSDERLTVFPLDALAFRNFSLD